MGFLGPHKYVPRCIECGYHQTEEMGEKGNKSHFCKHPEMPGKKEVKVSELLV